MKIQYKFFRQSFDLAYLTVYFALLNLLPLVVILFGSGFGKQFIVVDAVGLYSWVMAGHYLVKCFLRDGSFKFTKVDLLLFLYVFWSFLSFFLYLQPGNPASVAAYFYGIHHIVFPMSLFFAVKVLDRDKQKTLLARICYLNVFTVLVGFFLFYVKPVFYTDHLRRIFLDSSTPTLFQLYARMNSYIGSTALANISAVTAILIDKIPFSPAKKAFFILTFAAGALLSGQRAGFLALAIVFLYYLFSRRHLSVKKIVPGLAVAIVFLTAFGAVNFRTQSPESNPVRFVEHRLFDDLIKGDPLGERWVSWVKGWDLFAEFPLGLGIGATTSAADSGGANPGGQVVDANYIRILADLGLPGLTLFLMMIIFTLLKSLKLKSGFAYLSILAIYCMQALGTNIFDSQYVVHIFWLLLGFIDSDRDVVYNLRKI